MKRPAFLVLLLLLLAVRGHAAIAKTNSNNEMLYKLSEQIQQEVTASHYQTAQSLVADFQKKWSVFSRSSQLGAREEETMQVVSFAVSNDLKDPAHTPLIHDSKALGMLSGVLFNNEPLDKSFVEKQLMPILTKGEKQLSKHQENAFIATFNQWELDFQCILPRVLFIKKHACLS